MNFNFWTTPATDLVPPTPAPMPAWNPAPLQPVIEAEPTVEAEPKFADVGIGPVVVDLGPGEGRIFLSEVIAVVLTVLSYPIPLILRWARS